MKYKLFLISLFMLVLFPCSVSSSDFNCGYGVGWTYTNKWCNTTYPSNGLNMFMYYSYNKFLIGADFTIHMTTPDVNIANMGGHVMIGTLVPISKRCSLGASCNFGGINYYKKYLGYSEGWFYDNVYIRDPYYPGYSYYYPTVRYGRRDYWDKKSYFDFGITLIQEFYFGDLKMYGITLTESTSMYSPITISLGICMMSH